MVPVQQVQSVRELAKQNMSQRRISRTLGISRHTVQRILSGKCVGARPRPRLVLPNPSRPPCRCRQCGAMVFMPCLACQLTNRSEAAA